MKLLWDIAFGMLGGPNALAHAVQGEQPQAKLGASEKCAHQITGGLREQLRELRLWVRGSAIGIGVGRDGRPVAGGTVVVVGGAVVAVAPGVVVGVVVVGGDPVPVPPIWAPADTVQVVTEPLRPSIWSRPSCTSGPQYAP